MTGLGTPDTASAAQLRKPVRREMQERFASVQSGSAGAQV